MKLRNIINYSNEKKVINLNAKLNALMRLKFHTNLKQIWVNTHLEVIDLLAHLITFDENLMQGTEWPRIWVEVKKAEKMSAKNAYLFQKCSKL